MQQSFVSPAGLRAGDHAGAFTRSEAALARLARIWFRNAERARAGAIYLSAGSPQDVARLGLPEPQRAHGLVVLEAETVLAPGKTFSEEIFVEGLDTLVEGSLGDGFTGAHLFIEIGWSLGGIDGVEQRWESENAIHELNLLTRGDTLMVCQYGEDQFTPDEIDRARRAHPVVVSGGSEDVPASAAARVRRDGHVMHVSGELDRGTATLLVLACVGSAGTVTVDLQETTFFDVGAYRALSTVAKTCKRVRLRNAPAIVRRVVAVLRDEGDDIDIEDDVATVVRER